MRPNIEDKAIIQNKIKEYDVLNPVADPELKCPLFPGINFVQVCNMLKYYPHPAQVYILNNLKRFSIVNVGRQFGKSDIAALIMILGLMSKEGGEYMIVSVDTAAAKMIVNKIFKIIGPQEKLFKYLKKDNILEFLPTKSRVYIKTPVNEKGLVGLTLDGLLIDEASLLAESIWVQKLKATITVRKGWVLFTSTPLTENDWFYQLFKIGQLNEGDIGYSPNYTSFHFTSYDSPFQDSEALDEEKRTTPEAIFNQQFLAMPLKDAGEVFVNITKNAIGEERDPERGKRRYIIGWDLAKAQDYSGMIVIDRKDNNICKIERLNGVDWVDQIDLILNLALKYNMASIFMDASSAGGPVYEFLLQEARKRKMSIIIRGIKWTSANKGPMVQALVMAMEKSELKYFKDEVLLKEFEDYRSKVMASGHIQYAAKKHATDDLVSGLIMAWQGVLTMGPYKEIPSKVKKYISMY